jgi:hypothetical protein
MRTSTKKFGTSVVVFVVLGCGMVAATGGTMIVTWTEQANPNPNKPPNVNDEAEETSVWTRVLGYFGKTNEPSGNDTPNDDEESATKETNRRDDEHGEKGPGKRVKVPLEPELIESLPILTLEEVQQCNGLNDDRMLVTYQGMFVCDSRVMLLMRATHKLSSRDIGTFHT